MRVFWVMEAEVKFTHRALLPPTGEAQNRNTHTFIRARVQEEDEGETEGYWKLNTERFEAAHWFIAGL